MITINPEVTVKMENGKLVREVEWIHCPVCGEDESRLDYIDSSHFHCWTCGMQFRSE